jgi:hypothetical protein
MNRKDDFLSMMEALHVLNMARNKLISDFKIKGNEVYLPMFKYENHPELMNLALEKYFTSWVNFHFVAWHEHYPGKSGKLLYQVIRELLLKHSHIGEIDSYNHSFVYNLISSKIKLIDTLIRKGEVDNEKYNVLLLEYEKDKTLFEREIKRLKGDL